MPIKTKQLTKTRRPLLAGFYASGFILSAALLIPSLANAQTCNRVHNNIDLSMPVTSKNVRLNLTQAKTNEQLRSVTVNVDHCELTLKKNGKTIVTNLAPNLGPIDLMQLGAGKHLQLGDLKLSDDVSLEQVKLVLKKSGHEAINRSGQKCHINPPKENSDSLVLKFSKAVSVEKGFVYALNLDFDAAESLVVKGKGECDLVPRIKFHSAHRVREDADDETHIEDVSGKHCAMGKDDDDDHHGDRDRDDDRRRGGDHDKDKDGEHHNCGHHYGELLHNTKKAGSLDIDDHAGSRLCRGDDDDREHGEEHHHHVKCQDTSGSVPPPPVPTPTPVVPAPTPTPVVVVPTPTPVVPAPTPTPVIVVPTPTPVVPAPTPTPVVVVDPTPTPVVPAPTPTPVVVVDPTPTPVVPAPTPTPVVVVDPTPTPVVPAPTPTPVVVVDPTPTPTPVVVDPTPTPVPVITDPTPVPTPSPTPIDSFGTPGTPPTGNF